MEPVKERTDDEETTENFSPLERSIEEVQMADNIANMPEENNPLSNRSLLQTTKDIIISCFPLGFTTFGGPQAHIALLHDQFVEKRNWISEQQFTELFALGQSLPGPTSTQLVIAVGTIRGGILGGLLAFFCFSLPSAFILTLCGLLFSNAELEKNMPMALKDVQRGLACVGVALVACAAVKLMSKVATSKLTRAIMIIVACITMLYRPFWVFPVLMLSGGILTLLNDTIQDKIEKRMQQYGIEPLTGKQATIRNRISCVIRFMKTFRQRPPVMIHQIDMDTNADLEEGSPSRGQESESVSNLTIRPLFSGILLFCFAVLLIVLIIMRQFIEWKPFVIFETFFRIGSIIFGGGQVVVPMMLSELKDLITDTQFFNGFAIVSALPGPMFNFSAYLGAVIWGIPGALLCWLALFIPAFLFIWGVLPFWKILREKEYIKKIIAGVNAAAIGLVIAAVYILWIAAVNDAFNAVVVVFAFALVMAFDTPAPLVVIVGGIIAFLFHLVK